MSSQKIEKSKITKKQQKTLLNRLSKKDKEALQKLIIFGEELEKQMKE